MVGWNGAKFHANVFLLYGRGLSRNYVGNLATISEIEALPENRLYEAYIEQSLLGGKLTIKVGQQAADVDFFDSRTDDLFVNGTFGWPAIKASNLPAGGPAPPIAVPGIRVKAEVAEKVTVYAAIFNGTASAPGDGDPQLRDNHGLAFRVNDDPWLIGQTRFEYDINVGSSQLPGSFTPGGWYHLGKFDDQRFTADRISQAGPTGTGMPAKLRGNYGIFAVLEQTLYRASSSKEQGVSASEPGITMFMRGAYSPPDRNLIDVYADSGIQFSGFVKGRPADRFGFAVAYMHISGAAQSLDRDAQAFANLPTPVRSQEFLFEAIYEAHVKPGLLMAPYFQYVSRPSGGVPNPFDPTGMSRIADAVVVGLTTTLKY
jgi:porin